MEERETQAEYEAYALPGEHVWKSHAEYSTVPVIIGTPYYRITREGDLFRRTEKEPRYHLWELDTSSHKYHLRRTDTDLESLVDEGNALDRKIGEERAAADPFRFR